jgi:hypothetical protein
MYVVFDTWEHSVVLPTRRTPESQTMGRLRQADSIRDVQNGRGNICNPILHLGRLNVKYTFRIKMSRPLKIDKDQRHFS